jgi:hypothetical protein
VKGVHGPEDPVAGGVVVLAIVPDSEDASVCGGEDDDVSVGEVAVGAEVDESVGGWVESVGSLRLKSRPMGDAWSTALSICGRVAWCGPSGVDGGGVGASIPRRGDTAATAAVTSRYHPK